MKRKSIAFIASVTALILSLFTVACQTRAGYSLTIEYDSSLGSVTVTNADGAPTTEFEAGESVVISATPNSGYVLTAIKINGQEAAIIGNTYTFEINSDVVVSVVFQVEQGTGDPDEPDNPDDPDDPDKDPGQNPSARLGAALESVKTTFKATGVNNYMIEGEAPVVNKITTVFGNGAINIVETDKDGTEIYYNDVYVDLDGDIAAPYHTLDNKVEFIKSDPAEPFSDYDNPFKVLTADDFTATGNDDVFSLANAEKARSAATAITGYRESISLFYVTVSDGKITRIEIETSSIKVPGSDDAYYRSNYLFDISEWGVAEVDMSLTEPYERVAEHEALENALKAAAQAKNYTLSIYEVEAGYDDISYNSYVTETAVYDNLPGWEAGYVQSEGRVYPFTYDPETQVVTLSDATAFPTIASMRATFDGFAAELFEYTGNGVYVLRNNDLAGDILLNFADDYDKITLYYNYALNAKITLKDGVLYEVELDYYVYGAYVNRKITYSAFDTTVMPISFDNVIKTSVLDPFVGTYGDGTHTAVITVENGIIIDGEVFEVQSYDEQSSAFIGTWNNQTFIVQKLTQRQIVVYNEDDTVFYTLNMTEFEPEVIPEDYRGTWKSDGHTANITDSSVMFDDESLEVLSYSESEGLTAVKDGLTYNFAFYKATETRNAALAVIVIEDGSIANSYWLELSDEITIPSVFIGTFEGEDTYYNVKYKAVISQSEIKVTFGADEKTATVNRVEQEESWGASFWSLYVSIDGKEYVFSEGYSSEQLNFGSVFDDYASVQVTLRKVTDGGDAPVVPDSRIPEKFYGSYNGSKDGNTYYIVIDEYGIFVSVNGVEHEAVITKYDDYEGFTVTVNGDVYYITNSGYGESVDGIAYMSEDCRTVNVVLSRVA